MTDKDNQEKINKTISQIHEKLKQVQMLSMIDEGLLAQIEIPEVEKLVDELRKHALSTTEDTKIILKAISELSAKIEHQQEQFHNLMSLVSKMYQDGEINKDTFNKLDNFLKEYYDNPYQDEKY